MRRNSQDRVRHKFAKSRLQVWSASVIEQYDFLVTGIIAATIWGGLFFKLPGLAAAAAAISVYGLGIIIRPVGAFIFGNIADKYGRKDALVWALVLMGVSTLAIGLTPTYATHRRQRHR